MTYEEAADRITEMEGRIAMAREAQACCEACVTTWLTGELDSDQMERVLNAATSGVKP